MLHLALAYVSLALPQEAPARPNPEALAAHAVATVSTERLSEWHDLAAGQPHIAGTAGDRAQIEWMSKAFAELELEVERQDLWLYLCEPVSASLSVSQGGEAPLVLPLREKAVEGDPYSNDERLTHGWNAYSGSGTARGEVVYANHGRKEDFERLAELGVDCTGKIVLARYGGNYRGYKAKYAEIAGAAGLVIFSDPAEVGYARGEAWPQGGWANETSIQRGSILTTPYYGDPQTPFRVSTKDAERIEPSELELPTIPVQPCGWGAAFEILRRMDGASVPEGWGGALECEYRLTGGTALTVELTVEQKRGIKQTANVLGTLRGSESPDDFVVIGCHHDAWNFGAADATCGLISLFETARAFAELRDAGFTPRRSIVFAAWGAEEFGIIGSSEWVEGNVERLREHAVAYINLDMASMGLNFSASASPLLHGVIRSASKLVEHPAFDDGRSVHDVWARSGAGRSFDEDTESPEPKLGNLGGGSDHVGFLALGLVPSASFSGSGSRGNSYHTNYDNLAWYRQVVGDDYLASRMIAQMATATTALLADEPILPYDLGALGPELERHLAGLTRRGRKLGFFPTSDAEFAQELESLAKSARELGKDAPQLDGLTLLQLSEKERAPINAQLRLIERSFHLEGGLPGRPWFQNLFVAPDETSGYAAWMLPLMRFYVEHDDRAGFEQAVKLYVNVFDELTRRQARLTQNR